MTRYRQSAGYVAIWAVAVAVILLLGLAGCQYSGVVECADGCTVNVHDTEQDRGGQQTEALREPNVSVIP